MAAKYRAPIFKLMDKELDIDWFYGNKIDNIKEMDDSLLTNVTKLSRSDLIGPLYWQHNVIKIINSYKYQSYIILGDLFSLSTWTFLIKNKLLNKKKKVYLWSHGWYGRESRLKRWLKKRFFNLADKTFLYGNYAKEIAIQQGNNPKKLCVIHNSLDHETHIELRKKLLQSNLYHDYFKNSYPTLIFIGRLTKVKQLDLLIKAVSNLKTNGENYNIVFVGDGVERTNLEKLAKDTNLNVWFYGSCYDDTQTAQLIFDADLCVSPGNVGLTAMHTMSFGTPVLTHSNFTNQMPEFEAIVEGETGTFFSEGSVKSLSENISKWFKDHKDREYIREKCYHEIDSNWTPEFQLNIIKRALVK